MHKMFSGGMDMIMTWLLCIFTGVSCVCAILTENGSALSAAIAEGAQAGISLSQWQAHYVCGQAQAS